MKQDKSFQSLNTPAILVDLDKLEANIREMTRLATEAGVKLKPHTKIHECVDISKMQIEAGACGIEVGAIEQAEPMVSSGFDDIVVAHPFFGEHKLETLRRILINPKAKITLVVDMIEQAELISQVGQSAGRKIPVLIKIDTGVDRFGVLPGEPALDFARKLRELPGIEIAGIYAHESGKNTAKGIETAALEVASMTIEAARLLMREGFALEVVSIGASSTFRTSCQYLKEGKFPEITEVHPGALVVGDIMHVLDRSNSRESCALTVLTTVVSTSHPNHAVVDAGFKTFGNDSLIAYRDVPGFFWNGKPSWGSVQGRQDLWFGRVGAECGLVYYMDDAKRDLKLGDRLQIVPKNATTVINTHDQIYGVRNGEIEKAITITGREKGN